MSIFKSDLFFDVYSFFEKNRTLLVSIGVGIGLVSASLFYYASSTYKNNEAAYEAVGHLLQEMDGAYQNGELWNEIENGARTALRQFKGTTAQAYLQIILSEALIQQDNKQEGLAMLKQAVKSMPSQSPFNGLFAAKSGALQLMSDSEADRVEGIALLESLAHDKRNAHAAYAQFLLAQHYDDTKQEDKARSLYMTLAQSIEGKGELEASPFGLIARHRLNQGV